MITGVARGFCALGFPRKWEEPQWWIKLLRKPNPLLTSLCSTRGISTVAEISMCTSAAFIPRELCSQGSRQLAAMVTTEMTSKEELPYILCVSALWPLLPLANFYLFKDRRKLHRT